MNLLSRPLAGVQRTRPFAAAAALSLVLAVLPTHANTVLVDFEHRADGSPITLATNTSLTDDDVRAVFAGYGIGISVLSHPALRLLISNQAQLTEASGTNSFFAWTAGGSAPAAAEIVYRLVFDQPVSHVSFYRAGLGTAGNQAWGARALTAAGVELGRVSEGESVKPLTLFELPFDGIAAIEVHSNFGGVGNTTLLSPPLDDLMFTTSAVPEPQTWLLMASGLMALRLRARRKRPAGVPLREARDRAAAAAPSRSPSNTGRASSDSLGAAARTSGWPPRTGSEPVVTHQGAPR